jgi:hypothetical protein
VWEGNAVSTDIWGGITLYQFGPERDEVTGEWRKLHNEELSDLYCSSNIVQRIKSRRMGWAGHAARMVRGEACAGFGWGNVRERTTGETQA